MQEFDVIVVGAGNAALAAAVSARDSGARKVLVLEKAPREARGGNTHFSGGIFRFAFDRIEQAIDLVPNLDEGWPEFRTGADPYPARDFHSDLMRVTGGQSDPELANLIISNSYPLMQWMRDVAKMPFEPARAFGGEAVKGKDSLEGVRTGMGVRWQPGVIIRAVGQGKGLSKAWFSAAQNHGIEVRYDACVLRLAQSDAGRVNGVVVRGADGIRTIHARSVVLGCGGFEANVAWRVQYLGGHWGQARVRGCAFNHGDGLRMALDIGAVANGDWDGCHATPVSLDSPVYADLVNTDKTNRLSYEFGVMLNREGRRFLDEGYDHHSMTYALYGGLVLAEPGGVAFQIFDSKVLHLLEGRYATSKPLTADTLEGLIAQLPIDRQQAIKTLNEFNAAAGHGTFHPTELNGQHTEGIAPPKTNWAQKLDTPPYVCYPVTGGITFTFGGIKVNERAEVVGNNWKPIPGLYSCGEMVGGIFHGNYPAGTGLTSGAVMGRIAGASAATI